MDVEDTKGSCSGCLEVLKGGLCWGRRETGLSPDGDGISSTGGSGNSEDGMLALTHCRKQ